MLRVQGWIPRLRPRPLRALVAAMSRHQRLTDWAFRHYLRIAAPDRVGPAPKHAPVPDAGERAATAA